MAELIEIAKAEGYQKYKKTKGITTADSPYQVTLDDDTLICVTTTGDIELILPQESSMESGIYQKLNIINVAQNGYKVSFRTYTGDTFRYGNTTFILPHNVAYMEVGMSNHGHHIRKEIIADKKMGIEDWSASNFSSLTIIPFDIDIIDTQPEFYSYNTSTNQVTILTAGEYDFSAMFAINSTGGSTWIASAYIYVNGNPVSMTKLRSGNYGNEDQMMTGINWGASLEAGDVVDIRLDQNNLTGRLEFGTAAMRLRIG